VTKGQHFREVPLVNEAARETLRQYLLTRSVRLADAPLFLSQRGGGFSANTMQRLVAICYQRAGVKGSSHSGRRSYATNLIQAGADIYTVQILMGHSSIMTTQEYFTTSPVRMAKFAALLV
jgi:integrase/recombinase XerD